MRIIEIAEDIMTMAQLQWLRSKRIFLERNNQSAERQFDK